MDQLVNNAPIQTPQKPKSNLPKIALIWFFWVIISFILIFFMASTTQGEGGLVVFVLAPFILVLLPIIGTLFTYLILKGLGIFLNNTGQQPRKINWAYLILAVVIVVIIATLVTFLLSTPAPR